MEKKENSKTEEDADASKKSTWIPSPADPPII
jgi:hypothetical protein